MENLVVSTRKQFTMDKMFAQVKISAPNNIKTILNASSNAQVSSCDCLNGAMSISGKISADIVYLSLENKIETASAMVDFIEKQKANVSLVGAKVTSEVVIESINFSSNEAMVAISHTANVEGVYNYEIPKISSEQNELVLKTNNYEIKNIKTTTSDTFVVSEEHQTGFDGATVLSTSARVVMKSVASLVDKIVLEGSVLTEVLYLVDENIEKRNQELEFKQEIEARGVLPNMTADANVWVKNAVVSAENRAGKVAFVYSIELSAAAYVFEETLLELVEDLYSLKQELTTTYGYINIKDYNNVPVTESLFSGVIDISSIDALDDVVCVLNNGSNVVGLVEENENLMIECKQHVCVLYKTDVGIESMEESFDFGVALNKNDKENISNINLATEILSFKVKAGREIEVSCKYNSNIRLESEDSKQYISNFEVLSDKVEDLHGIKVYVAKEGQTVFEVAKILNVTPELIKEQNEIDEVFESGQKIYIYSPVNLV